MAGSYAAFAKLTAIPEEEGAPTAEAMIQHLLDGQETVVRTGRSHFRVVDKMNDEPTAGLLTQKVQVHEKTGWMLRSLLSRRTIHWDRARELHRRPSRIYN